MSAKSATLAKSLHTVSVLVSVAKLGPFTHDHVAYNRHVRNVDWAMERLGYAEAADPYGLAARAVSILAAECK